MEESGPGKGTHRPREANPLLDVAIVAGEAQLRVWEAFHVEGSMFVAKRMRANLQLMRRLGQCGDAEAIKECQLAWLADMRKDYAEEWARCAGLSFALAVSGFGALSGLYKSPKF
jgi:hypothetical protein